MDSENPPVPEPIAATAKSGTKTNRRLPESGPHIIQSALLLCSTALAAILCYLYITKPIVEFHTNPTRSVTTPAPKPPPHTPTTSNPTTKAPTHAGLEETNLRIQHILSAENADGHSDRIELTVPVLYRSRHLLWSDKEVDTAKTLMERLIRYQEQSRALREEGHELLTAWNQLVNRSLPSEALRADSPSLPSNQQNANDSPRPSGWTSTELIQIQGPEK